MSAATIEITQEFGFDAAHYLDGAPEYQRMHGHSFFADVTLRGSVDPQTGFLHDFGEVNRALDTVRTILDHRLLNEVEGLGKPTLENLARFIFDQTRALLPEVVRVRVRRPSCGQSCVYEA